MDKVDITYIGGMAHPVEEYNSILKTCMVAFKVSPDMVNVIGMSAGISAERHVRQVTGCLENGPDMVEALGDYMRPPEMFEAQYWIVSPPSRETLRALSKAMMKLPNNFEGDKAFEHAATVAAFRKLRGISGDLIED